MSGRVPGASAAHADAAHPPLSVAITTIGVMTVAMMGSTTGSAFGRIGGIRTGAEAVRRFPRARRAYGEIGSDLSELYEQASRPPS